jgi:hypothetical protein
VTVDPYAPFQPAAAPAYGTPAPAPAADVADVAAVAPELTPADVVRAMVGKVVQDDSGRYGIVVGEGRTPNLDHVDPETRQPKPESHEPLVVWLPDPAPWGHPLTVIG